MTVGVRAELLLGISMEVEVLEQSTARWRAGSNLTRNQQTPGWRGSGTFKRAAVTYGKVRHLSFSEVSTLEGKLCICIYPSLFSFLFCLQSHIKFLSINVPYSTLC